MMSPLRATILSLIIAFSYTSVLSLPANKVSSGNTRNSPKIVRNRMISVVCIAGLWLIIIPIALTLANNTKSVVHAFSVFGIVPGLNYKASGYYFSFDSFLVYLKDFSRCALLISSLFLAPLIDEIVFEVDRTGHRNDFLGEIVDEIRTIQGIRDLVVGPITEEIVYRGIIMGIFIIAQIPVDITVLLTPLFFSIAHLTHAVENWSAGTSLWFIVQVSGFQLVYTLLFGWIVGFMFVKTGNMAGICFAHAFCNHLGFRSLMGTRTGWWQKSYWFVLVIGAYGFYIMACNLSSPNAPVNFH